MTDTGLKQLLGLLLRNKETAFSLLESFKPEDIEQGLIAIPENLINRDIKMLVMDQAAPYLNDYSALFMQNAILIDFDVNAKQLGRLKAKYMLTVAQFDFNEKAHQISFNYKEDVKSAGNLLQSMALKAAGLKGTFLQTAAEMMKLDFLEIGEDVIAIYLDKLSFTKKIPSALNISYVSSENGVLKFKFHI